VIFDIIIIVLKSKLLFIQSIIKNKLKIKDLTKAEIIEYLDKNKFIKINDSFNYLLNMPIYNISIDQFEKLKQEYESNEEDIKIIQEYKESDMWIDDLKTI